MMHHCLVFSVFVVFTGAATLSPPDASPVKIPQYLIPLFPEEFVRFISRITPAEKAFLDGIKREIKTFERKDDFLQAFKNKSKSLDVKYYLLNRTLENQLEEMNETGHELAKAVIKNAYKLHFDLIKGEIPTYVEIKNIMIPYIDMYNALSQQVKDEFKYQFPNFAETIANPFVQGILKLSRGTAQP